MGEHYIWVPAATTVLLLLVSLSPTWSTFEPDGELVVDTAGNPLEVGSEYYIQRMSSIFPSALSMGQSLRPPFAPCPRFAMETPIEGRADTVKFIPANETQNMIHVSSDIKINSTSRCYGDDGLWRVNFDERYGRTVIMASGDPNIPRSWFKIHKVEGQFRPSYKITFVSYDSSQQGQRLFRDLTLFRDFFANVDIVGLTQNTDDALLVEFVKKPVSPPPTITSFK